MLGMLLAAAAVGGASLIAFGLHVPDLSTQSRLVTSESVPNLIGLAVGAGGETESLRLALSGVLAACVLACSVYAWRRQESLVASGWASVALLVTLSWVLPWYVLWVLPLAALSGSRRLGARVLRYRHDARPGLAEQALPLVLAQCARGPHVEARFHARRGDVGVLSARPRGAAGAHADLGERYRQRVADVDMPLRRRVSRAHRMARCV